MNGRSFYQNFKSINLVAQYGGMNEYNVGPSWMGEYMVTDSSGYNCFISKSGDTLRLLTTAAQGSTWMFTGLDSGNYIEASVSSCKMDTYLV